MTRMKGGQAVVAALIHEGVEALFGIPGVHTLEVYDTLYDQPQIRHIQARHEGGAALMADGYARASGKVGVALVITGPGVTNAATAIGQAYADGSPLLVISSEVDSRQRGKGNLHELRDQLGMTRALAKWSARAESVGAIPELIHQALHEIWSGWPGPAHVEIPIDILSAEGDVAFFEPTERPRPCAPAETVHQAGKMLREAASPLLVAGWGVTLAEANAELLALAERLQAPVLTMPLGKGAFPEGHPLALGSAWRTEGASGRLLEGADVALAVGTRLGAMDTRGWSLRLPPRLIHVDPDPTNIGKCYPTELGLVGDPKAVLTQLLEALGPMERPSRAEEAAAARADLAARLAERSPEARHILAGLRAALSAGATLSLDMTLPTYWSASYLPVAEPRAFLCPYSFMALGCGLPMGIGAQIARPERPVVVVAGDGGFLFTVQELATAAKYGLNITVLLCNNDCYGAIRRHQERRYDGRIVDAELTNPDFQQLAEAFGVRAVKLSSAEELPVALANAIAARGLRLIELPIHDLQTPW